MVAPRHRPAPAVLLHSACLQASPLTNKPPSRRGLARTPAATSSLEPYRPCARRWHPQDADRGAGVPCLLGVTGQDSNQQVRVAPPAAPRSFRIPYTCVRKPCAWPAGLSDARLQFEKLQ